MTTKTMLFPLLLLSPLTTRPSPAMASRDGDKGKRDIICWSKLGIDCKRAQGEVLEKRKALVFDFIQIDVESPSKAEEQHDNALYKKLLGKAPPLKLVSLS